MHLSLSPVFEGHYSNITKAIHDFSINRKKYRKLLCDTIEKIPKSLPFYLMSVDVTPYERKYARKLEDRMIIHKPNTIKGKPITIGHDYSQVVLIPEASNGSAPWVIPLSIQRAKSTDIGYIKGMEQVRDLVTDESLPFHNFPTFCLGDCAYSAKDGLLTIKDQLQKNLIFGARIKGDRKAYRAFCGKQGKHHPKWYGAELILNQPDKHFSEDFKVQYFEKNSRNYEIRTDACFWKNMVFKGSKDFKATDFPCTLVRIASYKKNGENLYDKPLWVAFYGRLRDEFLPFDLGNLYSNRFKIEHFFKFIKQNMLMNDFQTPDLKHEESWCQIQQLAYLQLYCAKDLAQEYLHPWEQYLPKKSCSDDLAPKKVQQYFYKLFKRLPRNQNEPVVRGRNSGRKKGFTPGKRVNHEVVVKSKLVKIPKEKSEYPLEKLFDNKNIKEENAVDPILTSKKENPELRKENRNPESKTYYQVQLFPKQILGSLVMPQGHSP